MSGGASPAESASEVRVPKGFHILMPPGWRRFAADEAGRRELTALVSERMKALGRPELDVEARLLIGEQWRRLRESRVDAVYLSGPSDDGVVLPASIAAARHAAPTGSDFATAVRSLAGVPVTEFDTPMGTVLRWDRTVPGAGDLAEVRSRQIGYGIAAPGDPRLGMIFHAAIPALDDTDARLVEGMVELLDTIMETFRWR